MGGSASYGLISVLQLTLANPSVGFLGLVAVAPKEQCITTRGGHWSPLRFWWLMPLVITCFEEVFLNVHALRAPQSPAGALIEYNIFEIQ